MDRRQKKSVQAINYLASKSEGGKINRLKLMKLLWIADKYHLLKYGRTILKDKYSALEHGPVASETMNATRHQSVSYTNEYIVPEFRHTVVSIKAPDISLFSESDIEVLNLVWEKFGNENKWNLRDMSHEYPEWKKFEELIADPTTPDSYPMELEDFFNLPVDTELSKSHFFDIPEGEIFESKQTLLFRKKFER